MSGGSAIGDADLLEMMSRQSPNADHDRRKFFSARGTSLKSIRRASDARSTGSRPRSVGRGRNGEAHREHDYGENISNGSRTTMKRRSKSLGQRMTSAVATTPRQREMQPAPSLNLYHVSRPEPRARWVFNLSSHLNVADNGPPPARVTSHIDKKRPNLGGLVWVNATLGGHCCLQKGTKSKVVTPVPPSVLDGWLNGQTGFWWIGALKEGHRALWDSHVVMSWAMVFIPSSPEVAARNNMEVWRDKCLKGSLRVARPGELERKIIDIVTDDQDTEPESVVHTHLCILLADGDDLELKRPRMFSATPRALDTLEREGFPKMKHSKSLCSIDASGAGSTGKSKSVGAIDLSQIQMVDGAPTLRSSFGDPQSDGEGLNKAHVKEAMEKVERYRERILILKEDRHAKKAMLSNMKDELQEKEEMFTAENERLRQERNEIRTRAKVLWMDLENLRRQTNENGASITAEQATHLKSEVDRLRRERNDARADAMRWLEEQKSSMVLPGPSPASTIHSSSNGRRAMRNMSLDADGGDGTGEVPEGIAAPAPSTRGRSQSTKNFSNGGGLPSGLQASDYKTAAALAKLRSKVDRLRKERDGAEAQAAKWLNAQREKLRQEMASTPTAAANGQDSDGSSPENAGGGNGMAPPNGPVVASLKAESSRLKRELDNAKKEAQRLRERAANNTNGSIRGIGDVSTFSGLAGLNLGDSKDENSEDAGAQARKALGQLLGQALNLLDPQAAADVAAAATSNAEGPAPTSDSETIVANVAKEAGGQQWATADAANSNESPRTRSNSPPTAQLVRVATLVSGK